MQNAFNYNYIDMNPLEGHNYYRMKNYDLDGKFTYSKIIDVYRDPNFSVRIYPNPVKTF